MKLGREVKNSTQESLLNTKKMEMQRTGYISKCSQRKKKKNRRKKGKIKSYLQKTLKAYGDRIKERVVYIMIILPGMRKMLLYLGTECSTCI